MFFIFLLSSPWLVTYGEWDAGLYLSVLIWATCGYEYAGFLIGINLIGVLYHLHNYKESF
jgi:hypothetical protein